MTRVFPKLGLGAVVLAIGFMAKLLAPHFEDPDFYWHVKTGEYLLSSWPLPRTDVFSYTYSGSSCGQSEWLSQVVLYLVFSSAGYFGTAVFVAALCAVCGWLTYLSCRKHMDNPAHAIAVALVCSLIFVITAPRPHLFSFVFFAATLYVLLEFKYFKRDRLLALLPVIMLLWANAHGGFFIGLLLIFLFAASEWARYYFQFAGTLEAGRLRKLSLWAAATLVASLANPQGIWLWWYPVEAIALSKEVLTVSEWQSPSFHMPLTQGFLTLVLFFFVAQAWSKRRPDLTEAVVPLVFIAGAFIAVRNLPLASMALAPFLAMSLEQVSLPDGFRRRVLRLFARPVGAPSGTASQRPLTDGQEQFMNWMLLIVAGIAVAFSYPAQMKKEEAAVAIFLPVAAADFLLANHIRGNMFNSYQYGGYLIFRLYPEQKVFVYPRTDIYHNDGFVQKLDAIHQGRPNWKTLFDRYGIDYVVCESDAALRQLLLQEGDFRLVFDDGNHSVLLKNIDKFRGLIARYG